MKKRNILKSVLLMSAAVLLTTTSCKEYLDVNQDPNNPDVSQGKAETVLPAAVASSAGTIGAQYAILGGLWSQHWTQSAVSNQYKDIDSYNLTAASLNNSFDELYSGALNDYQFVIKQSEAKQDWIYFLMGTVMKAYTMEVVVDLYDKAPYSEAFQGLANIKPKYDDGDQIYAGLIAEINNALSKDLAATTNSIPGAKDIVFNKDGKLSYAANADLWVRFANTLKLKMYLRMVYAKPAEAQAGIADLYTKNAQFLTTDAAMNNFANVPDKSNPLYEYNVRRLNTALNLRASNTFLSWLNKNSDPRIPFLFYKPTAAVPAIIGLDQGNFNTTAANKSDYAVSLINPTGPVQFISAAESYFLQAEALERFSGGVGAKTAYDAGVAAAFAQYGLTNATDFTADTKAYAYPATGGFEQKLEAIITQKWASMVGSHALEAFFEHNRTGYPKTSAVYSDNAAYVPGQFVYPKEGVSGGLFAKRLIFSDRDRQRNPNVPAMVALTEKVWWDKK